MAVGMKTKPVYRAFNNIGRNITFRDQTISPAFGTSIWELFPPGALQDPAVGFDDFDDFLSLPIDDTTGNPLEFKWASDTATGAITLPKAAGGVLDLATGGVDNNETYIQRGAFGGITAAPFAITDNSNKPVLFEVRAKALQHADEAFFVGLAEEGAAVANFLADNTGIPADKDYIGFRTKADASAEWDVAWKKAGQAEQEIAAVAVNADDWHIFSFLFDGVHTVYFYVDRVLVTTQALSSAATFPSGERLAFILAAKTGEGVAKAIEVDYYKVFQVR